MSPSSGSVAVPWKVMVEPEANVEPSAGWMMDTVGGLLDTVMVMDSLAVWPAESVTVAVMTCTPSIRLEVSKTPPVLEPSWILEVHTVDARMSPSPGSLAVA